VLFFPPLPRRLGIFLCRFLRAISGFALYLIIVSVYVFGRLSPFPVNTSIQSFWARSQSHFCRLPGHSLLPPFRFIFQSTHFFYVYIPSPDEAYSDLSFDRFPLSIPFADFPSLETGMGGAVFRCLGFLFRFWGSPPRNCSTRALPPLDKVLYSPPFFFV